MAAVLASPAFSGLLGSISVPLELELGLLRSKGSSYLTGAHWSSSHKPSPSVVAKHPQSSFCSPRCGCNPSLRCRGKSRILWNHEPTPLHSLPLLSAEEQELEKHQGLLWLPAVSVETSLLGNSTSSQLEILWERAAVFVCLCSVWSAGRKSLEGINICQMKEMGKMGEFASRGHQHTDAVARPGWLKEVDDSNITLIKSDKLYCLDW